MIRGPVSWYSQWHWKGYAMQPSSWNWVWLPSERNWVMTTFSVTTDKVSNICLSWKTACLIMSQPSWIPIWRPYDDNFHIVNMFRGINSFYFPSKVQLDVTNKIMENIWWPSWNPIRRPWRKFWHSQNVPRVRKHRYRHLNVGPMCNISGDIGKTRVFLAPCLKSIWRPPGVAHLWGLFCYELYII